MDWQDVVAHLRQYPYLDDNGNLNGFSQRRPFAWKNGDQGLQYLCVAHPIFLYDFFKDDMQKRADYIADSTYAESIRPHFSAAIDAVLLLKELIEHGEGLVGKEQIRIKKQLDKITTELTDLEPSWRQAIEETGRKLINATQYAVGELPFLDGNLLTFLKLDLFYTLNRHTNLTRDNKLTHVVLLLNHFGIVPNAEHMLTKSLNRLIKRHGTEGKQAVTLARQRLESWYEYLSKRGDI
jgi:hypothetical protein